MYVKHVRDPVIGYIGLTDVEKNIVDTYPVQRLRGIKQLSVSNFTYPGGDHSRFSHSLGTMHFAGKIAESLRSEAEISEEEWQLARLAGLLHDVGHGPFSHSYEAILSDHRGLNHEDMGAKIIEESSLADELSAQGFDSEEVSDFIFGEPEKNEYLKQIITSQFDADKMDFLIRDSYFTGVEYGQVDVHRLIQAMELLEEGIAIHKKALAALETFMIARYEMFLNVYYHHSVRAAEITLRKAMDHACEPLGLTNFDGVEEFLQLNDAYVMEGLRRLDPTEYEGKKKEDVEIAKENFHRLSRRNFLKTAYERGVYIKEEYVAKLLSDENVIREKESEIAEKARVDSEYIHLDVPTLASIPYYPGEIDPMEVPVFEESVSGERELVPLSEHSRLVDVLKGYMNIIRVFTTPSHREKVSEASKEVFKELPFSSQISM